MRKRMIDGGMHRRYHFRTNWQSFVPWNMKKHEACNYQHLINVYAVALLTNNNVLHHYLNLIIIFLINELTKVQIHCILPCIGLVR